MIVLSRKFGCFWFLRCSWGVCWLEVRVVFRLFRFYFCCLVLVVRLVVLRFFFLKYEIYWWVVKGSVEVVVM